MNGKGVPNIVIPTNRPRMMKQFFDDWQEEFKGCHVIVVLDGKRKEWLDSSGVSTKKLPFSLQVYDWDDIDEDLGENSWIIPRRTDCVRSYGYYKAWQNDPLFIVTLDDDTKPKHKGHIQRFYSRLFHEEFPDRHFYNTMMPFHSFPRGTYGKRVGCHVAHGVWDGVPDLSGVDQAKELSQEGSGGDSFNQGLIPKGALFSMCGMNLAWKPEVTPLMYFGLQGGEYPIDRCGDIWCGYRLARNNVVVATGEPFVEHNRASNVWSNIKKEENAEKMSIQLLNNKFDGEHVGYWGKLKEAEKKWEELFTLA